MIMMGTATADVTPGHPVELAGFAHRSVPMTGVRSPLELQAFAFGTEDDLEAVLVCADLLWWGPDLADQLRAEIGRVHGLDRTSVLLHASHTHSGPQPGMTCSPLLGRPDSRYLEQLKGRTLAAVAAAAADREPVSAARGSGHCGIGMNRRLARPDGDVDGPDPDGVTDPEVTVINFSRQDGSIKAILTHFSCHPVITGDLQTGPDYPGVSRAILSQRWESEPVIGFLQGCCGDINPALVQDSHFVLGAEPELDQLGGELAATVEDVLTQGLRPIGDLRISTRAAVAELPLQTPSRAMLAARSEEDGIWGDWSRHLLGHPEQVRETIPLQLTMIEFGDDLALLGMDAEVSVDYGLSVKSRSAGRVLPLGYSNGMIGYVVTAAQLRDGGYEPDRSYPYVYRAGRFAPAVEPIVRTAIDQLLQAG